MLSGLFVSIVSHTQTTSLVHSKIVVANKINGSWKNVVVVVFDQTFKSQPTYLLGLKKWRKSFTSFSKVYPVDAYDHRLWGWSSSDIQWSKNKKQVPGIYKNLHSIRFHYFLKFQRYWSPIKFVSVESWLWLNKTFRLEHLFDWVW